MNICNKLYPKSYLLARLLHAEFQAIRVVVRGGYNFFDVHENEPVCGEEEREIIS
jgi:hypothetical protein